MRTLRLRLVALVAAVAAAALLPAANADAHATSGTSTQPLAVTGYQQSSDNPSRIDADRGALTDVGVDGITLEHEGGTMSAVGAGMLVQLAKAHADGLRAEFLVSNWSDKLGDFDEVLASSMLRNAAKRANVIGELVQDLTDQPWDGITIDLESLNRRDSQPLAAFLRDLKAAMPAGRTLDIDLMNSTTLGGFERWGYWLGKIAAAVDTVTLMAYDQHGPWEPTPGPVNALPWQRKGLDVLLTKIPRAKVNLGVAGYGYAWMGKGKPIRTVTDAGARRLVKRHHATAHWNARAGEWTAKFGTATVWWSDARSYRLRVALATKYRLHGLAIWSLAQADVLPAR